MWRGTEAEWSQTSGFVGVYAIPLFWILCHSLRQAGKGGWLMRRVGARRDRMGYVLMRRRSWLIR
jgi:hypothetical protein